MSAVSRKEVVQLFRYHGITVSDLRAALAELDATWDDVMMRSVDENDCGQSTTLNFERWVE